MVYVVTDGSGYSKIGYAKDWRKRVGTLQIGNPRTITVQMLIQTRNNDTDKWTEGKLHEAFANSRQVKINGVQSEWFLTDGIQDLVCSSSWRLNKLLFGEETHRKWAARIICPPQGKSIRDSLDERTCVLLEREGVFTLRDAEDLVKNGRLLPEGVGETRWERIRKAVRGT